MTERPKFEADQSPQRKWFAVLVPSAHVEGGGAREGHHTNYVFAINSLDALNRVKRMRGWKKSIGNKSFPSITELEPDEVNALEKRIAETPNIDLSQAKRAGYYGRREFE